MRLKPDKAVTLNGHKMSPLKYNRIIAFRDALPQLDEKERLGSEDIAARLGISAQCVRDWLRILGHRLHNHNGRTFYRHDKEMLRRVVLPVYRKTRSAAETARIVGINASSVWRFLANNGHLVRRNRERDISKLKFNSFR